VALPTGKLSEDDYEGLWQGFVSDHNKVYSPSEVVSRFSVFKDNVNFITDHNKRLADKLGYTVGINQFADMTNAEFKRTMTGYNAHQKVDQSNVKFLPEATEASVDWTTKNAVTPVKNQGQCGSCWAFSTTGSLEGANAIKNGKLVSYSEQELVDCAGAYGNQGCNGGLMDDGFKYVEAKGDALESKYPYTGTKGESCNTKEPADPALPVGAVTGYTDVPTSDEAQLMAAVEKQPVSVAIEADQSGFQFYKDGVFSGTCGTALDHGVLVVGYGTDGGKDFWKVKNSWGATWGSAGYIQLARNIATKGGQCGVAMQPSYPQMGPAPPPGPPTPPAPTPPSPPPAPPSGKTHYGDPANGCEADEQAVQVQGLSGKFCSPDCASAACPTDVPAGTTAAPQCALKTQAGDKRCALICSPSTDEASLRAGDAQCGAATCQPIQTVGICTYGGSPSPPGPPPPPSPSGECTLVQGLECAKGVEGCIAQCKSGVAACIQCLGGEFATCCPCLKKLDPKLPISCGSQTAPEFMTVIV